MWAKGNDARITRKPCLQRTWTNASGSSCIAQQIAGRVELGGGLGVQRKLFGNGHILKDTRVTSGWQGRMWKAGRISIGISPGADCTSFRAGRRNCGEQVEGNFL